MWEGEGESSGKNLACLPACRMCKFSSSTSSAYSSVWTHAGAGGFEELKKQTNLRTKQQQQHPVQSSPVQASPFFFLFI
jgi:hypothetical protein